MLQRTREQYSCPLEMLFCSMDLAAVQMVALPDEEPDQKMCTLFTELYFQGEQCGVGEGMCAALLDAFPQTRQEGDSSRGVGGP